MPEFLKSLKVQGIISEDAEVQAVQEIVAGYSFGLSIGVCVDNGNRFIRAMSFCRRRRHLQVAVACLPCDFVTRGHRDLLLLEINVTSGWDYSYPYRTEVHKAVRHALEVVSAQRRHDSAQALPESALRMCLTMRS